MNPNRDNFNQKTKKALAKRAAFICSNPDCHNMTLAPCEIDSANYVFIGVCSHISSAAQGGPRYNLHLTSEQRGDISNGIFLCNNCATMIDKNNDVGFDEEMLLNWKNEHENWVKRNLNKSIESDVIIINGEHNASGIGNITADLYFSRS